MKTVDTHDRRMARERYAAHAAALKLFPDKGPGYRAEMRRLAAIRKEARDAAAPKIIPTKSLRRSASFSAEEQDLLLNILKAICIKFSTNDYDNRPGFGSLFRKATKMKRDRERSACDYNGKVAAE
jgi:hypothetical protein